MDAATVALLGTPEGEAALALAVAQDEPASLAAGAALRTRFAPELAAVALTQAHLRRRAVAKFGPAAAEMFFTPAGLEQASRADVATHHAARFVAAGARRVVDLGCGIGADARALVAAGLSVVAVELDPVTAEVARLNLGDTAEVINGDAERLSEQLLGDGSAAFCDPARRNRTGRLWRVEDFTPSWSLVRELLDGSRVAGVKLGPALPHALVPATAEAEWVSSAGDTVEVGLWAGAGSTPGRRVARVLPDDRLVAVPGPDLPVGPPGRYLYEPAGAAIRAGVVAQVGRSVGGWLLDAQIAYLASDTLVPTPFAEAFEVREVLPYRERALRSWLREHEIGSLEILQRGITGDPAALRRRLQLRGRGSATLVLSRTPGQAVAMIADRVPRRI